MQVGCQHWFIRSRTEDNYNIGSVGFTFKEGYFKDAGIDLDLVTGFGADKVMTAVLSGEADIGFMGPETTVYTANEGSKDPVINFAQI